jgi:hypothetical protein
MFAENPDWTKSCPDESSMVLPLGVPIDAPTLAAGENALTARNAMEAQIPYRIIQRMSRLYGKRRNI